MASLDVSVLFLVLGKTKCLVFTHTQGLDQKGKVWDIWDEEYLRTAVNRQPQS